jgi:hypothetical protein
MARIATAALSVSLLGLVFAACESRGGAYYSGPGPYAAYDECKRFASCAACTPVVGCGWCQQADGKGLCAADPDECASTDFSWTWDPGGCSSSDGGVSSLEAGPDAADATGTLDSADGGDAGADE